MPSGPTGVVAKLHPTVLFNICDSYIRRNDQQERVIGTLCGSISSDGTVEIRNSYAVPHSEMADQVNLLSYCGDCLVDPHYAGILLFNDSVEWSHVRYFWTYNYLKKILKCQGILTLQQALFLAMA